MRAILLAIIINLLCFGSCFAISDNFPAYEDAPAYTTYFADGIPNNVYHVRTTGSDTGSGTYASAWASLAGGQGTIAAGDLVLFHEGDYTAYTSDVVAHRSTNRVTTHGTASDMIVFLGANKYTGYTSEAAPRINELDYPGMTLYAYQVVDGVNFRGGLSVIGVGNVIQNIDFDQGCSQERDGNGAMILFPSGGVDYAEDTTIRNNTFHDSNGTLTMDSGGAVGRTYAMCFFNTNTDSDGGAWNGGYTDVLYNKFYNFDGSTSQKFVVYVKDNSHGLEVAYNRFYESDSYALGGWGQGPINVEGYSVHDNLLYNMSGIAMYWGEAVSGKWYNNVVIDDDYSDTAYYAEQAAGVSLGFFAIANDHSSAQAWGEVYDNALYVDQPGIWYDGSSAAGYGWWTWVDYNAYASSTTQAAFENANSGTTNWQQNDTLTANDITVNTSTYFATIPDDSVLIGGGRYGGNIGGFTFDGTPTATTTAYPFGSGTDIYGPAAE